MREETVHTASETKPTDGRIKLSLTVFPMDHAYSQFKLKALESFITLSQDIQIVSIKT